jgi:hypothetical protein
VRLQGLRYGVLPALSDFFNPHMPHTIDFKAAIARLSFEFQALPGLALAP